MKSRKHQKGITLFGFAFIMFLIGFTAFTVLKLFPVYMENFTIRSSVKSLEEERGNEYFGAFAVRQALLKRFGINNVSQVSADDVSVVRDGAIYNVDVDYDVRIPFIGNISLLVSFTNHAEVSAR